MRAIWIRAKNEMRGRVWALVLLALVLAVTAGASLAAAAGARRTMSAYPRFTERYPAYDASVSIGGQEAEPIIKTVRELPMVADVQRATLFVGGIATANGRSSFFPDAFLLAQKHEPWPSKTFKVLDGRLARAADEAIIGYALAERLGVKAGDRVTIALETGLFGGPRAEETIGDVHVTGVVAMVGGFETLSGTSFPFVVAFPPAFEERYRAFSAGEDQFSVTLHGGEAAIGAFAEALREAGIETDGPPTPASAFTPGVQALNRVPAVALWIGSAFLALVTLAIVGQTLSRESFAVAGDHGALRALGMSRRQLRAVAFVRGAVVGLAGAAGAVLVAWLLSPFAPVGLARIAEPDPGFSFDPFALGLGALFVVALITLASVPGAIRVARAAGGGEQRPGAPSAIVARLARAGARPSVVSGIRMALEPGRGSSAVPVRTAALGTTLAIVALLTAVTFRGSVDRLSEDPTLSGYVWDAVAIGAMPPVTPLLETIRRDDRVAAAAPGTVFSVIDVGASPAAEGGLALTVFADGHPAALIAGRHARAPDEIVLDTKTMRLLDVAVGDRVWLRDGPDDDTPPGERQAFTLVGSFAVPFLPFQSSDNAGQAAAMTIDGLASVDDGAEHEAVYVRFRDGVNIDRAVADLREATEGQAFATITRRQTATVSSVARIADVPSFLAGVVGLLGVATLVHALITTIQRRRRDLAILKTIGFVGGQVRASVASQATSLALVALLVGAPLGVAAGRWGWRLFAEHLGVVPVAVLPAAIGIAMVAGVLTLANVIAVFPARAAARTHPAIVLRSE